MCATSHRYALGTLATSAFQVAGDTWRFAVISAFDFGIIVYVVGLRVNRCAAPGQSLLTVTRWRWLAAFPVLLSFNARQDSHTLAEFYLGRQSMPSRRS